MEGAIKKEYESWKELLDDYHTEFPDKEQWMFRGQETDWPLQPTLERLLGKYLIPLTEASKYEHQILREFIRQIGNYRENYNPSDVLECLSLLQHYGGPTRLLDFTYSFYIAAFFALAQATPNSKAVIWCFRSTVWDELADKLRYFGQDALKAWSEDIAIKSPLTYGPMFGIPRLTQLREVEKLKSDSKPCLFMLSSRFLNLRVVKQQGVFLAQTDLSRSFVENGEIMLQDSHFSGSVKKLIIKCSPELLKAALTDLRRMYINFQTLFDDISYFFKSLALGVVDRYGLLTATGGTKYLDEQKV
jgi:hypothetical protein